MTFTEADLGLVLRALHFSAQKHRDQRRKDSRGSPYINHPIQVAETLWRAGGVRDPVLIVGALLHDTIEDTETTREEIDELFGDEVGALVLEVTDDKSLPKQVRKRLQVERAPHKSDLAKQLKLADKICNVADVAGAAPEDWSLDRRREYLDWSRRVVDGLRGVNARLEAHYDAVLSSSYRTLEAAES